MILRINIEKLGLFSLKKNVIFKKVDFRPILCPSDTWLSKWTQTPNIHNPNFDIGFQKINIRSRSEKIGISDSSDSYPALRLNMKNNFRFQPGLTYEAETGFVKNGL